MKTLLMAVTLLFIFGQCGALVFNQYESMSIKGGLFQLEPIKTDLKPLTERQIFIKNQNDILTAEYFLMIKNVYEDIYLNTKTEFLILKNRPGWVVYEKNQLARMFFDKNLWDLGFYFAVIANTGVLYLLDQIQSDNKFVIKKALLLAVNIAEVIAVNDSSRNTVKPVLNIKADLLTIQF